MRAPRRFPSSKTCSNCGSVHQSLDLSEREFRCETSGGGCGLVIDRDLNAAVNLAAWAEAEHRSVAQTPDPQAGGRVINACGGTGAGHRSRVVQPDPQPRPGRSRNRSVLPQLAA
jgi:putative transposase